MPALDAAVRIGLESTGMRRWRNDGDRLLFLASTVAFANGPKTHSFCPWRKDLARAASAGLDSIGHEIAFPVRQRARGVGRAS